VTGSVLQALEVNPSENTRRTPVWIMAVFSDTSCLLSKILQLVAVFLSPDIETAVKGASRLFSIG